MHGQDAIAPHPTKPKEIHQVKEPIRKIELKDGTVRYRLVVDIGQDENGKRQQLTRTFDKLKEARAELSRIRHETDQGTYVKPSELTVDEYLDEYFKGATRGRRESTKASYRYAFLPVRDRLGARKLQSVTKADIEDLVDWMLTSGRRRGGEPGTALAPDRCASPSAGSRPRSRWPSTRESLSATWSGSSSLPSTRRRRGVRGRRRR
jgi:hypothetical protein